MTKNDREDLNDVLKFFYGLENAKLKFYYILNRAQERPW